MQDSELDDWDPMLEDYMNPEFNSYTHGPGKYIQNAVPSNPITSLTVTNSKYRAPQTEPQSKVYVCGIPTGLDRDGIYNLFSPCGTIKSLDLRSHSDGTTSFAFIEFHDPLHAAQACEDFKERRIGKHTVRAKMAHTAADKERVRQRREGVLPSPLDLASNATNGFFDGISGNPGDRNKPPGNRSQASAQGSSGHNSQTAPPYGKGRAAMLSPMTSFQEPARPGAPVSSSAASLQRKTESAAVTTKSARVERELSRVVSTTNQYGGGGGGGGGTVAGGGDGSLLEFSRLILRNRRLSTSSWTGASDRDVGVTSQPIIERATTTSVGGAGDASASWPNTTSAVATHPVKAVCQYCKQHGGLKCKVCRTPYCSMQCQRLDWPQHKDYCNHVRNQQEERKLIGDVLGVPLPLPGDSPLPVLRPTTPFAPNQALLQLGQDAGADFLSHSGAFAEKQDLSTGLTQVNGAPSAPAPADLAPAPAPRRVMAHELNAELILPQGEWLNVTSRYCQGPDYFCVQPEGNLIKDALVAHQAMTADLEKYVDQQPATEHGYRPEPNELIVGLNMVVHRWQRGVVQKVGADTHSVLFFDTAILLNDVPFTDTHPLPAEFARTPALTVACELDLVPAAKNKTPYVFAFNNFMRNKARSFQIKILRKETDRYVVEVKNDFNLEINKKLVEDGLARRRPIANSAPSQINNAPAQIKNASSQISNASSKTNNAPAQINSVSAQINNVPAQINNVPAQINNVPAQPNNAPAQATNESSLVQLRPVGAALTVGAELTICVSQRLEALNFEATAQTPKFVELMRGLNSQSDPQALFKPVVGDLIVAKFEDEWYRARVQVVRGDVVDVYYVDYGNRAQISVRLCRVMSPRFNDADCYFTKCSLAPGTQSVKDLLAFVNKLLAENKGEGRVKILDKKGDVLIVEFANANVKPAVQSRSLQPVPPSIAKSVNVNEEMLVRVEGDLRPCGFQAVIMREQLLTQVMDVGQYYTAAKAVKPTGLTVGDHVVGLYDNEWCRARVVDINDKVVKVFYIDYGNTDAISRDNLRVLEARHAAFPGMAATLQLRGAERSLADDAQTSFAAFFAERYAKTCDAILSVRVVRVDQASDVIVVDLLGDVGRALMVRLGELLQQVAATPRSTHKWGDEGRGADANASRNGHRGAEKSPGDGRKSFKAANDSSPSYEQKSSGDADNQRRNSGPRSQRGPYTNKQKSPPVAQNNSRAPEQPAKKSPPTTSAPSPTVRGPPPIPFARGQELDVVVLDGCPMRPSRFVCMVADTAVLQRLLACTGDGVRIAAGNRPFLQQLVVGAHVVALYENEWARARVDSLDGSSRQLFYIDFGNTAPAPPLRDLRIPDDALMAIPYLAYPMRLVAPSPPLHERQEAEFSRAVADVLAAEQNRMRVKVVEGGPEPVVEVLHEMGAKIRKILDGLGQRAGSNPAPVAPHHRPVTPHHRPVTPHRAPMAPQHASVAPQQAPVAPRQAPVAPHQAPAPSHRAPVAPHQALVSSGQHSPAVRMLKSVLDEFARDAVVRVTVANEGDDNNNSSPDNFTAMVPDVRLTQLDELMADVYGKTTSGAYRPSVGEYVAALFEEDRNWYRARVLALSGADMVDVWFVDYGNKASVSVAAIRRLDDRCYALPYFAGLMTLNGTERGPCSDRARRAFADVLARSARTVEVMVRRRLGERSIVELCGANAGALDAVIVGGGVEAPTAPITPTAPTLRRSIKCVCESMAPGDPITITFEEGVELESPTKFTALVADQRFLDVDRLLTSHYKNSVGSYRPVVDEYVASLFDGVWYRALVTTLRKDGAGRDVYDVRYVDYGNAESAAPENLRQLDEALFRLPHFAARMSLVGFENAPRLGVDTETFRKYLMTTKGARLDVTFVGKVGDRYTMKPSAQDHKDIMALMTPPQPERGLRSVVSQLGAGVAITCVPMEFRAVDDLRVMVIAPASDEDKNLFDKLEAECSKMAVDPNFTPSVGSLVVGFSKMSRLWSRGRVLSANKADRTYAVDLLDFSELAQLTAYDMRPLSAALMAPTVMSAACRLGDVTWTASEDAVLATMRGAITALLGAPLQGRVLATTPDGKLVVDLPKFRDVLVQKGVAYDGDLDLEAVFRDTKFTSTNLTCLGADWAPGAEHNVLITHLVTPDDFYAQPVAVASDLAPLLSAMTEHYGRLPPNRERYRPLVGAVVAARFTVDGQFYRAEVRDVRNNSVTVFYVDFGNGELVNIQDLYPLAAQFASLPLCAVRCRLAYVTSVSEHWDQRTITLAKDLTNSGVTPLRLKVTDRDVDRLLVDLVTPDLKSLKDVLVQRNLARVDAASLKRARAALVPTRALVVGAEVSGTVSWTVSPDEFYVHVQQYVEDFTSMDDRIQELCARLPAVVDRPTVGDLVLAHWQYHWYRAAVIDVRNRDVDVKFIDFGNVDVVRCQDLRAISSELITIPTFAVLCSLFGVAACGEYPPEVCREFKLAVTERSCVVRANAYSSKNASVCVSLAVDGASVNSAVKQRLAELQPLSADVLPLAPPTPTPTPAALARRRVMFADLPPVGEPPYQALGTVLSSVSPGDFYCVVYPEGEEPLVTKIYDHLKAMNVSSVRLNERPAVGDVIIAPFSGSSYRAVVRTFVSDTHVAVKYIDYGNEETLPWSACAELPVALARCPPQARHAAVFGILPIHGKWSKGACSAFQVLVEQKTASFTFLGKDARSQQHLLALVVDGSNAADWLVASEFAKRN